MKRIQRFIAVASLAASLLEVSGCAQLMGALRRDLDDSDEFSNTSPTTGGRWTERGFLSPDLPEGGSSGDRYVGHSERNPASSSAGRGGGTWLTSDHIASNRRDSMRGRDEEDSDEEPTAQTDPVMLPSIRRQYKNGVRATRADFVDESQNESSLWASDGQTNYYFTKNKIRGVGDILTINIEADMVRDIALESRRTLSPREREFELNLAQERLKAKALGLPSPDGVEPGAKDQVATTAAAPARAPAGGIAAAPAPEVEIPTAKVTDVDVGKSLSLKSGDPLMAEIVERYPNGNYKVRATKRIPYRGGPPRFVNLVGVVKGSDIADDDTVPSGKLYEYRIEASR